MELVWGYFFKKVIATLSLHLVALFSGYQDTIAEKKVVSAFLLKVDLTLVLEYKKRALKGSAALSPGRNTPKDKYRNKNIEGKKEQRKTPKKRSSG